MLILPDELQAERNAVIAEIYAAFKGVSREGGVSWNETKVMDDYGSEENCRKARATDTDMSWTELATDENWDAGPGFGGWSFLDPIGFRYYLPGAMVRVLRSGHDACSCFPLDFFLTLHKATKPAAIRNRDWTLEKWSLLDDRQKRCVARFIRFMIAWELSNDHKYAEAEAEPWRKAYALYWKAFE